MKKMNISSYRLWLFVGALFVSVTLSAQPIVSGLDKTTGAVGEEVTISGLNLPTGGDLRVHFGGAEVINVVSSSSSLIVVEVPAGATYGPVIVTNDNTGLSGSSTEHFLLSFQGSTASFSGPTRFGDDGSNQPFDLTTADFDGDGDMDVVMTHEKGNEADIFTNQGTNPVTFVRSTLNTGGLPTRNIDSGDLDGDGFPDIVVTRGNNGNSFTIFDNTFASQGTTDLPDIGENIRIARRPVIRDLDGDGKPEIIVSNESDNIIHVYVNESTGPGDFSFDNTPIELEATGSTVGISGLAAKDLNNDGFPEVVANAFLNSPDLYIFRNTSSPGSLNMLDATVITAPSGQVNLEVGDFDGDGFNDVVTTSAISDAVLLYRNTTTQEGSAITMEEPVEIDTDKDTPLGLALGDLNGDGMLDIAVGHEAGTDPEVIIMINTTTGTDFSFDVSGLSSERTSRNVKIADLNSDGRPDIAYTNDIVTDALGDLAVFENTGCVEPEITPSEDQLVCQNAVIVLEATHIAEAGDYPASPMGYQWKADGVDIGGANGQTYTVPTGVVTTVDYTVEVTDGSGCMEESAAVEIEVSGTPVGGAIDIIGDSDACVGSDFTLTTSEVSTGYFWTGPNDFSSNEQNPELTNIGPEQAGTYTLQVELAPAACLSSPVTMELTVINVPQPVVFNANDANFCEGNTIEITTPEYDASLGLSYSWNLDGDPIDGETDATLEVSEGGDYTAVITDGTCTLESPAESLNDVAPPASSYDAADAICVDLPLDFTATSTGVNGFTLVYSWDSGSGEESDLANPTFTYTSAGTFDAVLTTSYDEVDNCSDNATSEITAQAVPTIDVEAQSSVGDALTTPFEKCPSDSVTLSITGLMNVAWKMLDETDTLASGDTFTTTVAGDYTAMGTDDVGCEVTSEVNLANFEGSGLTLTSSSTIDLNDEIQLEEGQEEVDFTVSGGMDYMWVPEEIVDNPSGAMVIVTPYDISTVVSVTGVDINDCVETASVTIIDSFVTPRTSFSPNGDGIGDCWEIPNLSGIPGVCSITVFDSRGRRLFETASPFGDDCVWDGAFNGSQVPAGVYYYAMSCEDNNFDRSGSILLAR